jgi:hypothetical protein
VGQTLTADEGNWTGAACPSTFTNQWQRSAARGAWTKVATGATYTPAAADVGATLRVEVSASNCNGGEVPADSAAIAALTSAPLLGDVNGDGQVNALDALCVLRIMAQLPPTFACTLPLAGPSPL